MPATNKNKNLSLNVSQTFKINVSKQHMHLNMESALSAQLSGDLQPHTHQKKEKAFKKLILTRSFTLFSHHKADNLSGISLLPSGQNTGVQTEGPNAQKLHQ